MDLTSLKASAYSHPFWLPLNFANALHDSKDLDSLPFNCDLYFESACNF